LGSKLERETAGEKAEEEGEGDATEPREESKGANAGLSVGEREKKIPMTARPSGCPIASPILAYFELKWTR